jgi:O-antigen/teichoic acid export membrane protein
VSLRNSTFSASRWTAASTVLVAAIQILQTSVLARILLPGEFGLMAIAAAAVAVLSLVVDLGLSQALIHYDDVPPSHRSSIFWLNMLLAFVLMAALSLAAPAIARLYHSDALAPLLCWTSLVFPLAAAGQQLRALAAKALRFDVLARIEILAAVCACACAIVAALLHAGVYALAVAVLANAAIGSLLAWLLLPHEFRPGWHLRPSETRRYLHFGGYLVGESIANAFHRNADVFAGGLVVGANAMGVYSVPRDLSLRVATGINSIVTRVGFPVMAQVKHDRARLKSIYLQTLRMTASVNFPAYVAMGLFAKEIVALLYGPQWREAAMYLQVLAAWGLIRSTGNPVGSLIYATGRTRRAFWWNIAMLLLLPLLYWIGAYGYGLPGLAATAVILQAIIVIPVWYLLVRPCCGATLAEYLTQFGAPLLCALAAGAVAWLGAHNLPHGTLRLAVGGILGAIVYLALSWPLNRPWVDAMLELLHIKKLRGAA